MGYSSLRACVDDLAAAGQLRRIDTPLSPRLEIAEVQRRVFARGGPALLFTNVAGTRFPVLSNLFGTSDRVHYIFRDALDRVRRLVELKIDPGAFLRQPWRYAAAPLAAWTMLPKSVRGGPVLEQTCAIQDLPQLVCWPEDGGAFITLPQVYTEHPDQPGWQKSNLGMYRVQLSGGSYTPGGQIGLHYQIHRGIGVHHAAAIARGEPLRVNIFVGGPPAMALAAVMPLPEGLSELMFAGALNRRRVRMTRGNGHLPMHAEADFVICGSIDPAQTLPEGPFGDHLGYYARVHDFPVMRVERVYCRRDAIWPVTVVGRPPQEDTLFGQIIHEITGPVIPSVLPGVRGVHAVDAAGVHPLLLAIGSERYVPYEGRRKPRELHTQALAILGQGQLSLAKYLWIVAHEDDPGLDVHDIGGLLRHALARVDWTTDAHFLTRTNIDTLDYSGSGLNEGSKVFITAAGPCRRELPASLPVDFNLPAEWGLDDPRVPLPGVLVLRGPRYRGMDQDAGDTRVILERTTTAPRISDDAVSRFCARVPLSHALNQFPLVVVVDDSEFTARTLNNFLWVTFTRSNPAHDMHGVGETTEQKHWGCRGALVIDARQKPWHAPPLVEDPDVTRKIDALGVRGGPLEGLV
ncbi:MAG: UbiD family decarboxylase [Pirellulales bacterium]|nr:UbiD family decarboxylase [Pirellulales bacterium]